MGEPCAFISSILVNNAFISCMTIWCRESEEGGEDNNPIDSDNILVLEYHFAVRKKKSNLSKYIEKIVFY